AGGVYTAIGIFVLAGHSSHKFILQTYPDWLYTAMVLISFIVLATEKDARPTSLVSMDDSGTWTAGQFPEASGISGGRDRSCSVFSGSGSV
ncbi:MAG: hypothetical protein ACRD41_06135, partial [Candidatus Acidiferrales bacterium]